MPTLAQILAEPEETTTGTDLASIVASEREPAEPIGDPVANRQAVADGHLTGTNPATAMDGIQVIGDFEKQDPLFAESRKIGAVAVDNYLATLSPAERNAIEGSEHLDSDFPDFPGLEADQGPFTPRDAGVTPTLGGRPEGTIPTRLKELGLTREFFANIPEMVKETFKQQAGGIALSAGEQTSQSISWRDRLGKLAEAAAGPAGGVDEVSDILPGPVRVAKELGDWATDAIAQGFGVDSALVEGGQQLRDEALTRIAQLQPAEKTFMQEVITSGTQSAALALPGMAVSMITRNPTALLAAFGASTYGDSYGTARDAGKSPEEAHRFAMVDAGIEVGTEIGPAKIMLGASKTAIRQTLTRLFKSEMGGETLATIGQKVNSAMAGVDTMPLDQWMGELWEELKVTWATTAILTPLQGATAKLAGKAVDRLRGTDITGELETISPEETAAINEKANRAGKALKATVFTAAGVAETDLDLSDEQIQKFIDNPDLSDISETDLDAIIGDEANEEALISSLVDRESGAEPAATPDIEVPAAGEQLDTQLSAATTVEEERAVYDRRNEKLREIAVKDMTPEQKDRALLLNDLTHIPNRRAYSEDMAAEAHPVQVAIDLDSLKWINDNGGHESGDELLGAMASAVKQVASDFGIKGYHFSGDEFALAGLDVESSGDAIIALHQLLENATVKITDEDGNTITTGVTFGFGTDQNGDFKNADKRLIQDKERSKELGQKADRGEVPRNVQVVDSKGQVLSADDTASYFESLESQRRAEAASEPKLSDPLAESVRNRLNPPAAISGESLRDFSNRWDESGVENSVSEGNGIITLSSVTIEKDAQGQGTGSEFISELTAYADQTGQKIALTPSKDFGATSIPRLKKFYKRFGFVENKGRNRDFSHLEDMYRDPQAAQLEPFSPDQIESVPLREAVESGLISEDEGAVIDGFLDSLPESLRKNFDVVFSGQEFEPTEAQLKAHDLEGARGQVVRGALLERIKNEARDTIVMFGGSDVTTFFHEFGELSYKRLLTSDERKYVSSLKSQAGSKAAPNEWFSDQLQSFMVQEKEEVFTPKLQKILSRIADTIRKIWERIRTAHRTPALDEIFRDILSGQRRIELEPVDTASPEFQAWSKGHEILEGTEIADAESGKGYVFQAFHGTTHNFDIFDPTQKGQKEGQFGEVNYFTSDQDDADANYAGLGPDLTNRIEQLFERLDGLDAEEIADQLEIDIDEAAAAEGNDEALRQLAEEKLSGGDPKTLELFIRSDNPAFVGGDTTTFIETQDELGDPEAWQTALDDAWEEVKDENGVEDDERDDFEGEIADRARENEGLENLLLDAIDTAIRNTGNDPGPVLESLGDIAFETEITATELEATLRDNEALSFMDDPETGDLINSHIIGQIFKELGFDSLVLQNANERFQNMDMGSATSHIHVFEETPANIKSVTENVGTFDPNDPNIRAAIGSQEIPEEIKDRFIDEDLAEQYGQAYRSQLNAVVAQSDIDDFQAIASEASKLAVERTDQHFKDQEKLVRADAKKRAEEVAASEPVSALMDEAISQGRIKLTDQIKADYGLTITEIINKRPGLFSKDGKVILDEFAVDEGGYESERDFVEAMANAPSKVELRATLEKSFVNEDLLAIDQYRDELWQEQFFIEESQAITELLEKKKPAIRKDLKGIIRRQTGQVREEEKTVTESEALKAAFTKAAQAARAAERAGDQQGVAREKARMKAILASAKERKQAQESRAKALDQIKKELKTTKIKKQGGKPRGKFTADIQEIFNTLRADLKLNKVDAFNKIAKNLDDYKDSIPPFSIAIENRLLSVIAAQGDGIGRLEFARIQQQGIENLLTEIKGLKGVGKSAREAQVSDKVTEITDAREKVIDLVGGIPEGIEAVGEEGVTLKGLAGIKQGIRNALIAGRTNSVVGWKDLLDIISFHDKTSKPGESAISKFGDVLEANNAEKQGNINAMSAFRGITFETYGLDSDSDMVKKFTQDAIIHDLGEFKTLNDVFIKLRMTRAEIRKRAMEIMDPTLHDTIFTPEGMGWTQEMSDAVFDFLTPQDEDFIAKQLEFYQKYYESINEVYKVIYGVNLPKNINYSPIAREGVSQDAESTLGEFFNEISLRASADTAGSIKSRVATKLPLRPQSDISVIQQHVAEMEHFKAWSEKIRDLNAVFGDSDVRQAIRVNFGDKIDGEIQRFIIDMARGGTETSTRIATLDRMMGKYARSVLALKPSIFLKQLTSTIAYADSVPAAYWTKEVLKVHEIPKAVDMFFNEKTGSTLIKSRWDKGDIERDISNAMKSSEFARVRAKPSFLNAMMFNVKLGDMGAIIVGGYPVYKYHRSQGLSHEEALKRFESVTESTQQSADISQQSSWQRGGSFAKLFTMFMSSPNQYLRKEIGAIRNLAAGRMNATQFAKTMMIYHVILPMFFQLASDRFVWSGDEDEDALIPQISGEQKRAMILGSLNGFFIVGDALEAVISKALDLKVFGFENPMWSIVNDAMKAWPLLDWDDIDPEDFIIALRALAGATGAAVGLPLKQTVDFVSGFNETLSGEYETGIAQMMGWSPHQAQLAAERSEE